MLTIVTPKEHIIVHKFMFYSETGAFEVAVNAKELKPAERDEKSLSIDSTTEKLREEYDGEIYCLELPCDVRNARKVNLAKGDCFLVKEKPSEFWDHEIKNVLYIPETLCKVERLGERVAMDSENEVNYKNAFKLIWSDDVIVKFNRLFLEKIETDGNYKPQDGPWHDGYGTKDRPHYSVWKDFRTGIIHGVLKRWCEVKEHHGYEMVVWEIGGYTHSKRSEFRCRARQLSEELKQNLNISISSYDMERLLKEYSIVRKEGN